MNGTNEDALVGLAIQHEPVMAINLEAKHIPMDFLKNLVAIVRFISTFRFDAFQLCDKHTNVAMLVTDLPVDSPTRGSTASFLNDHCIDFNGA